MLIILDGGPVTAPFEARLSEEFEAEIIVGNLVREVPRTVAVRFTRSRFDEKRTAGKGFDVRIIERVDIHSQSTGMLRQRTGGGDVTVAEAR